MSQEKKKVLVALDGSEYSERVFEEAIKVLENKDSELYLVSILDTGDIYRNTPIEYDHILNNNREVYRVNLEGYSARAEMSGLSSVESILEMGDPKSLIVKIAKEKNIDLIIVGSTGKGTFERMIVGTTASYIINHASCNVLVVK